MFIQKCCNVVIHQQAKAKEKLACSTQGKPGARDSNQHSRATGQIEAGKNKNRQVLYS